MSKRFKVLLVFAACFLFASGGATALTLTQAKIMALEKNHDIRVWMLGVDAARGEHKSRSGVYDPEVSFKASYADTKNPTPSALIEDGIINAEVFSFGSELSGMLPTGTFYKLYDLEVSKNRDRFSAWEPEPFMGHKPRFQRGTGTASRLRYRL